MCIPKDAVTTGAVNSLVPGLKVSSVDDTLAALIDPLVAVVNTG
jgi:hypothetical protein